MKTMNSVDKALAWVGLAFGGGLSIAGNLRAATLPALPESITTDTALAGWRALPTTEASMTSLVAAVAVPFAAVLLVEMLNRWTFLPALIRRGAIGTVAFIAAAASWVHLFTVMMYEGNHPLIAAAVPLIPDTIAIVSAMALLSGVRTDTDTLDAGQPDIVSVDTLADMAADIQMDTLSGLPMSGQPDTAPDTVPDMDNLPAAPVDIVRPRRPIADKAWKADAVEMIRNGDPASDQGIADKILANNPGTWSTPEAGRKAVERLRKTL